MAYIKVKRPWTEQPQRLVEIDPNHWAFKDIVFAFSAGRGFYDGKHPGLSGTLTTFTTIRPGAGGRYLENTVPGNNAFFSNHADHDTLGGLTLIALVQPSSVSGQMTVVSKDAGGGGADTPLGLLLDSGAVSLNRANAGFRVWKGVATLAAGQLAVVAATQGANIGTAPRFYINGRFDTGTPVNLFSGAGTGAPIATTQGIKVSANTSFSNRFLGGIYDAIVINKEYSDGQVAALSREIWSIWKPRERKIWFTAASGSSGTVAVTNASDTSSASGATTVTGSLAKTAANDTSSASGTTTVTGSLARTSANDTVTASGSTTVTGSSSTTNAGDTLAASGSVGSAVSGALSRTNANDGVTASGTTTVTGSFARTNASDSLAAVGSVGSAVSGSLARTNANDNASASGTTTVIGSLAKTSANDSLSASGSVGSTVGGAVARTNASDTASASGTTTVTGTVAKPNASDTSAGAGTTAVIGAVARTNANDSLSASGSTSIVGWLAKTHLSDTLAATGAAGSGPPPIAGPAGSGPRLRFARGHRPGSRNTSRPAQLR